MEILHSLERVDSKLFRIDEEALVISHCEVRERPSPGCLEVSVHTSRTSGESRTEEAQGHPYTPQILVQACTDVERERHAAVESLGSIGNQKFPQT